MKIPGLFKKLCAATLAMTIAASGAVLTVCAADRSDPAILDRTDVRYNNNQEISRMSASENIELVRTVADGYMNFKKKIDISSYHLPVEAAGSLHTLVCAVYPEIFFVDDIRYTYWHDDNGYLTAIQAKYLETDANGDPDKETISKQLQEFYNEADRYLALVSDELSACRDDFSKALVLHDELVLDVHYDINSFSNYNLLVKKYGLCRSYARIYAYLLGQLGIKTETIYSKDMNHVWLKVCLDGTYYNVDPTWDDPTPDESGKVSHSYFLFSDGAKSDHYNYFSLYSSTNKKYDNIKLHNYNSKICKINANDKIVYAIDNNNHKLVKYNYATNTETTLLDLNSEKWKSNANGYTWNKSYSSLEAYDGYLFYNTPDKIWRYDPSTGKAVWFWTKNGYDNKQIFGLRIENGNLYSYASEYSYSDTTKEYIGKASDFTKLTTSVIISPKSVSMYVGDKKLLTATRTPNNSSDGLTFSSSDSSIATTEITNGKVYVKGIKAGKAVITAETSSGIKDTCIVTVKNKTTAIKAVTLKTTSYTYDGKAKKPSVTVKDANGKTVSSSNYTVSYSNNTKTGKAKVTVKGKGNYTGTISKTFTIKAKSIAKAKVSGISTSYKYTGKKLTPAPTVKDGTTTLKKGTDYTVTYSSNKVIGTAKVTIKGKGNYSGTMTKNFTIKPKTVTIKSATSPKTKHLKATWKTDSTVTGYQVTYSTNKNFKSGNKSVTVTKKTSSSTNIKNLTKGKTYYVKVRAYKIVNNKKVFGAYSTVKTVKIK